MTTHYFHPRLSAQQVEFARAYMLWRAPAEETGLEIPHVSEFPGLSEAEANLIVTQVETLLGGIVYTDVGDAEPGFIAALNVTVEY